MEKETVVTGHLMESLEFSAKMLDLADRGVNGCQDDGCLVLYGIIRDCAYKIRLEAEKELKQHLGTGVDSKKAED